MKMAGDIKDGIEEMLDCVMDTASEFNKSMVDLAVNFTVGLKPLSSILETMGALMNLTEAAENRALMEILEASDAVFNN